MGGKEPDSDAVRAIWGDSFDRLEPLLLNAPEVVVMPARVAIAAGRDAQRRVEELMIENAALRTEIRRITEERK